MKKLLALSGLLVVLSSVVGCSSSSPEPEGSTSSELRRRRTAARSDQERCFSKCAARGISNCGRCSQLASVELELETDDGNDGAEDVGVTSN